MSKSARYEAKREVRTFVDLNNAATIMLNKAREGQHGIGYLSMSSLLLRAFTFEAYLNHLGGENYLKVLEGNSRMSTLKKYRTLGEKVNIKIDFSIRPYLSAVTLFKFRNIMVHGRTEELTEFEIVSADHDSLGYMPKTDWENYYTIENAEMAYEDITQIITELHVAAGLGPNPFIFGMTQHSTELQSKC